MLGGHEGPTLAKGLTVLPKYLPTYEVEEVKADKAIDQALKALLIVRPRTRSPTTSCATSTST